MSRWTSSGGPGFAAARCQYSATGQLCYAMDFILMIFVSNGMKTMENKVAKLFGIESP